MKPFKSGESMLNNISLYIINYKSWNIVPREKII